ncbi:type II secretion system protein N [Pelosinus sp. sgz500959]|uniref:type II secretion system protein N n=1 Tax=Pelosinus sp. sgz500959 TaxID=3242472 RepID=UPI00366B62AC
MSLSSDLKKIANKQYHLTARERLLVIVAIGVIGIAITLYVSNSEVAVEPTAPNENSQKMVSAPTQPVLPIASQVMQVTQVEQGIRDPFAKPPEVQEQKNNSNASSPFIPNNIPPKMLGSAPPMIPKNNTSTTMQQTNMKLTGIVGSTEQRLAVIMSGSKSQSYSVNEMIGIYKLIAINNDSVVLQNSNDKLVLQLEAAGQKGDNNSAK